MAHICDIQFRKGLRVGCGDVIPRRLLLAVVRERLVVGIEEFQAVEDIDLMIAQLLFDELLLLGLGGDMLDKSMCITDRAAHHARRGVLVLPDHADDLQLEAVVVERAQTKLLGGEVDILFLRLVIPIHIRREDIAEACAADLLVAPALHLALDRLL